MNTIPDLIPLHDSRRGLRTLLQVEIREPSPPSPLPSDGRGEQPPTGVGPGEDGVSLGSAAVLDFIASTATVDRYHEIIEPAGWRLESYRRNPVFQNAHNYGDILFTLGKALVT